MLSRRFPRALAAALTAAALTLSACTSEDTGPQTEAAVGLPVDAARITVEDPGSAGKVLAYAGEGQQSVTVEVAEGFDQSLMQADAVDVQAPAGGDVTRLTLPMEGVTAAAAEPAEGEREATRDVSFTLGRPSPDNLELAEDVHSAEGFRLGWRAEDDGQVSTVRLAAPTEATDDGRALAARVTAFGSTRRAGVPADADANLQAVFGGKKVVNMFEMTKLVSAHLS